MEFRLLGPVEVLRDGARLPIPGRHLPKILAVLLDEADRVVPSERLAAAMWDDPPPETARHQVQKAVSALRKALGTAGGRLVTVGDGYRLRVSLGELDLSRCRAHESAAARHRAAGRIREALNEIESGIALWRGPPLAGLSGRLIESIARSLEEYRTSLAEERAELKLELGEHGEIIAELRQRCDEEPFRQRTAAQLMTALHRSGRTAEALEHYGELRARLADELGLDPNDELQALHRRILSSDLPAPGTAATPRVSPIPAQLPSSAGVLAGREDDLRALDQILTAADAPVAVLSGAGGIGKTALAIHWGRLNRDRFADGQLYLNLRGFDAEEPLQPLAALQSMLRSLGHPPEAIPSEPAEAAALYRSLLADRSTLVVLDNARAETQVRPLLPGGSDTAVIVTSRNALTGLCALDGARMLPVGPLDREASIRILSSTVGDNALRHGREAASRIAGLCGDVPLALRLAGAGLASSPHRSPAEFAELLAAEEHRIGLLSIEGDPSAAVATAFEHSLTALAPEVRRLCFQLALIPGEDFSDDLVHRVMGGSAAEADRATSTLVRGHLMEHHRPGRFRFHDLMKLHARQRAVTAFAEDEQTALMNHCIDWYIDHWDGEEFGNALDACREWRSAPRIWRLANAFRSNLMAGYRLAEVADVARTALETAERLQDVEGQVSLHSLIGAVAGTLGERELGLRHGQTAVDLLSEHDYGDESGRIRLNFGANLYFAGRIREGERYTRDALEAMIAQGDEYLQMLARANLAEYQICLGRFEEAEASLSKARALSTQIGRYSMAWTRTVQLRTCTGRFDAAGRALKAAREVIAGRETAQYELHLHISAGEMHSAAGRPVQAKTSFEAALELCREHDFGADGLEARAALARVNGDLGDPAKGMKDIQRLLVEIDDQTDPHSYLEVLDHAAAIALQLADFAAALAFARDAYNGFAAMENPQRLARSLLVLARAEAGLAGLSAAKGHLEQAQAILADLPELPETAAARALALELSPRGDAC